jgi:hypothetical protein
MKRDRFPALELGRLKALALRLMGVITKIAGRFAVAPFSYSQRCCDSSAVGKQAAVIIVALLVLAVALICTWGQILSVYIVVPAVVVVLCVGLFSMHRTLDKHPRE